MKMFILLISISIGNQTSIGIANNEYISKEKCEIEGNVISNITFPGYKNNTHIRYYCVEK